MTNRNRLAQETSPYLPHRGDNPVDWHPWGDEALQQPVASPRELKEQLGVHGEG